jgi:hypothetical protein
MFLPFSQVARQLGVPDQATLLAQERAGLGPGHVLPGPVHWLPIMQPGSSGPVYALPEASSVSAAHDPLKERAQDAVGLPPMAARVPLTSLHAPPVLKR